MIPVLKSHVVKKGEGMIGILKRNGLDPKDWKAVYKMSYNAPALAGYKKLGHIEPGDKIFLPTMKRGTFETIESALFWIEDRLVDLFDTYGKLRAEYDRLRRAKSSATEAYEKAKSRVEKLEKKLSAAKKECSKVDKKTGKERQLGSMVKCLVDAAPDKALMSELEYLRKNYKKKLEDKKAADKTFKKLDDLIAKRERFLKKAQDSLRDARNYFLKLEWQMYG